MRGLRAIPMVLVLLSVAARAQVPPEASAAELDAVLAAFAAGDAATLATLAARDTPDPWLVADGLCGRGEFDAAEAFAKASARPAVGMLAAYVASRRGQPADAALREAIGRARAALADGKPAEVLPCFDGLDLAGASVAAVTARTLRASALKTLGRAPESGPEYVAAAEAALRLGWLTRAVDAGHQGALLAHERHDCNEAARVWQMLVPVDEALGRPLAAAELLGNSGTCLTHAGRFREAVDAIRRSLEQVEKLGDAAARATAHCQLGDAYNAAGSLRPALACYTRAVALREKLGDPVLLADALTGLGIVHYTIGDFAESLRRFEQAFDLYRAAGHERGMANCVSQIGNVYYAVGDSARAIEYMKKSLAFAEKAGNRTSMAAITGNIGAVLLQNGDIANARPWLERAIALKEEIGDRQGLAMSLGNLGILFDELSEWEQALACYERARKLNEEMGDRLGAAKTLGNVADLYLHKLEFSKAVEIGRKAAEMVEELGAPEALLYRLKSLGRAELLFGDYRAAVATSKRAIAALNAVVRCLGEAQGAMARSAFVDIYDTGLVAARELGDAAETAYFLESGRAGALLEALGGQASAAALGIPEPLSRAETEAAAAEAEASGNLGAAMAGKDLKAIAAAKKDLAAARERLEAAVDRIQREAKAAADVLYPEAAGLAAIQAALGEGEALVLYGREPRQTLALSVTRAEARIVRMAPPGEIDAACAALALEDPMQDPSGAIEKLAALVVAPLTLPADVRRVLVSPAGGLSHVPFAALFGYREVAYVPSGTTFMLLATEREKRGEGVLALGDPEYGKGGRLTPIPATREEARAVGDRLLLGADATETKLVAELSSGGGSKRWRAVHLACHGLVDTENPQRSSLAIAPDATSDGFLTMLDVFSLRIPADLVVLSACETARGKVYSAEGVVGFTRAFMLAGAPRVIVSLWKVDDEATQALMKEFYRLWLGEDGAAGLPTAAALRRAQESVAAREKWRHPYYWAAWQLWGLPD